MRRTVLLEATKPLTLLVASGVTLAVTRIGTDGPDTLMGTNKADNLVGLDGNDRLFSLAGRDALLGGPGKDVVLAGGSWGPVVKITTTPAVIRTWREVPATMRFTVAEAQIT